MLDYDEIAARRTAYQLSRRRRAAIITAISIALWALIAIPLVIR